MDDFTLLKALQKELIDTLQARKKAAEQEISHDICKAKIHRLRLQIQEVMLRIERSCGTWIKVEREEWYK